jgi:two-component system, NtrC family, response regulator AtoC
MHTNCTVLIIDDKEKLCRILAHDFENIGYKAHYALNSREALPYIREKRADVVLLDLRLKDEDGIDILKEIKAIDSSIPVIIMTGYASIETAVDAIKLGAWDYMQKPLPFARVQRVVENALQSSRLSSENAELKNRLSSSTAAYQSMNPGINSLMMKIHKMAETDFPVVFIGESGTGKEIMAEYVHNHSTRASRKMFKINCASFPANLLDNELFGHEKGAYTGANSLYKGIFEQADGGTLFLDEIGDMPLEIQARVLRTLQNSEIRRLGGDKTIKVNVRFIAATNKDLEELIKGKQFREDLYYRLNTAVFRLPPLRERKDDLPGLISNFMKEYGNEKALDSEVRNIINSYFWPGNIRELKNVMNFAMTMSSDEMIRKQDLPPYLTGNENMPAEIPTEDPELLEKEELLEALKKCRYNKKKTAEYLNISRRTIYNRLEKHGLL